MPVTPPPPGGMPGQPGAAPAAVPGSGPGIGGPASPMTTPQPQEGLQKAARVEVQVAVKQLQRLLPAFPIESDENKAVMNALRALQNGFGKTEDQDRELIPAEIMQLLAQVGPGTAPPGAAAMAGKPNAGMPPALPA